MDKPDFVNMNVHRVEYLAAAPGLNKNGRSVVITIRPDLPKWRPHNIALSASQAARLRDDLVRLFEDSPILNEPSRKRKRRKRSE